jgi:hypothetical protein
MTKLLYRDVTSVGELASIGSLAGRGREDSAQKVVAKPATYHAAIKEHASIGRYHTLGSPVHRRDPAPSQLPYFADSAQSFARWVPA